jgi:general secretion pathway protein G
MRQIRVRTPNRGVTLLELMIGTMLVGVLAAIAVPSYQDAMLRTKIARARTELMDIRAAVLASRDPAFLLPVNLNEVSNIPRIDPWGNPYVYLYFNAPGVNRGDVRKDHNLVPINSEFDLYSKGKDGESRPPLPAKPSQDDVLIARDGAYVGLAADF